MKKYDYDVISPRIRDGKFVDGVILKTVKGLFGKEKTIYDDRMISEKDWLKRKGEEGWELISVLRNSMTYDLREYYFKREITTE